MNGIGNVSMQGQLALKLIDRSLNNVAKNAVKTEQNLTNKLLQMNVETKVSANKLDILA